MFVHCLCIDIIKCIFYLLGLHLPEESQTEIKALKNRINDLCIQFNKHVNDESTVLEYSEEELFGMPTDFLSGLKKVSFWILYLILYRGIYIWYWPYDSVLKHIYI